MEVKYKNFSSKRCFGVEFEFSELDFDQYCVSRVIKEQDPLHSVSLTGYSLSDGSCWHIKTDSTCGWEVASYKGSGIDDINCISNCIEAVGKSGVIIDWNCGLHVHIDVSDCSKEDVAKIVAQWFRIEPVMFYSVPEHRRSNIYCKTVRSSYRKFNKKWTAVEFYDKIKPYHYNSRKRRRVSLNICNFEKSLRNSNNDRKTLEFRFPEMSVSSIDIKNWIKLFILFVENSKNMEMPDDLNPVDVYESLKILDLCSCNGSIVLSTGLFNVKNWFLTRMLQNAINIKFCNEAITILNQMWMPFRNYYLPKLLA